MAMAFVLPVSIGSLLWVYNKVDRWAQSLIDEYSNAVANGALEPRPAADANRVEYVPGASAAGARADNVGATEQGPERKPQQPSRRALVSACVLGLLLVGSAGAWLAFTHGPVTDGWQPVPPPYIAALNRGDYATALRFIRPLADQGDAGGQYMLGFMYDNGHVPPPPGPLTDAQMFGQQDYADAVKWYRKAADQGHAAAQSSLGGMYFWGRGVTENDAEAVKWYRRAADQGYAGGQYMLGFMYDHGRSVPQNSVEAAKWFRFAADQGDASAQFELGYMYNNGRAMPKDYVNAHMWFNLAAAQDYQDAAKTRELVEQRMTPTQIAEAQKLAREWKPKSTSRAASAVVHP